MKKIFSLVFCIVVTVSTLQAQNVYNYFFNNSLTSSSGGPALAAFCPGSYTSHTFTNLGGVTKPVYRFTKGCGLVFNDAGNFLSGGSYSIEMYFSIDSINSIVQWIKLIDYKNRTSHDGAYIFKGTPTFWYNMYSPNISPVILQDNVYAFLTVTRNAVGSKFTIYCNGQKILSFVDSNGDAVYDVQKKLHLLMDDAKNGGTEQMSGNIAMLRIYNSALDSATAVAHYAALQATLDVPQVEKQLKLSIAPNPSMNEITISYPGTDACSYEIYTLNGAKLMSGSLNKGDNKLSIQSLVSGVYLLRIFSPDRVVSVERIIKQ
jgi:hypothetical protein